MHNDVYHKHPMILSDGSLAEYIYPEGVPPGMVTRSSWEPEKYFCHKVESTAKNGQVLRVYCYMSELITDLVEIQKMINANQLWIFTFGTRSKD